MGIVLYILFFLSGSAALLYEVAWMRSLSLVFGGSHLAVTVVLSVYMGGLALGSRLFGRRADAATRPLRLYGLLELGIAAFALVFMALMRVYPVAYGPLARIAETNRVWLSVLRTVFAAGAMIVPATLMGGTLPVLSRFVAASSEFLGRRLAFLYGVNTLGAVAGAFLAGFFLLKTLGVTSTMLVAAAVNALVGLVALALPEPWFAPNAAPRDRSKPDRDEKGPEPRLAELGDASYRWVLWGIGVSGFCALGYEVLWTRMLSLVVGTSVYSFAIMLVAFLAGIGLGSQAYGLAQSLWGRAPSKSVIGFGLTQIAIGLSALAVTVLMRDLPTHAARWQGMFSGISATEFGRRLAASFLVAFGTMFVPAFFMGVAFPLAGAIGARHRGSRGAAVGEVLTSNTIGAILGAAASGFVLVYAFGIERSLQMLVVLNLGVGAIVVASVRHRMKATAWIAAGVASLLLALAIFPDWGRAWDRKYFAIFRNNQRDAFDTRERIQDALENTDVLYYSEGANEIISVIRPRGGNQAFLVNGRPEATTSSMDMQCQRTLGHLPMLLHPNPRNVFVLGTGTGMTLGATSIHPEVESIVLAEIEPTVLAATRTFGDYNHRVLDNPKLRIVFNDGRNYLATTRESYDVITADPIHPWSGGAAYLYTAEYFRIVAGHLRPGGIACQWLPIYELTPRDVKTVVRTFGESFRYVAIWLTHYDAEIVGSNAPIVLDEGALARRMAVPAIAKDLESVEMGSAEDFLSYFVAATSGSRRFAEGGAVNTDDNLVLEFSAPESMGVASVMGDNVRALASVRENLLDVLTPASEGAPRAAQVERWKRSMEAARLYDQAHALFLWGEAAGAPFEAVREDLLRTSPGYAPFRFLEREYRTQLAETPRQIAYADFPVSAASGGDRVLQISAVTMSIGARRAVVLFVDNDRREIYGQRYLDGDPKTLDSEVERLSSETMRALEIAYDGLAADARREGRVKPTEAAVAARLKDRGAAAVAAFGAPG